MQKKFVSRLKAAACAAVLAVTALPNMALSSPVIAEEEEENFARLLQHSMTFYDANMCGCGVEENSLLSWRGNCHTYDANVPLQPMDEKSNGTNLTQEQIDKLAPYLDPDGDGTVDVSGGFHDAGDHVEFGMPENYTAATLGWGYYEFREAYKKSGQDAHIETILRYFNDYLMRCTFLDENGNVVAHCYQVGDGDIDHALWQSPEVDGMARPAFFLTDDKPQVDYVVSAAASLIINSLNFKESDPEYAEKSFQYGKALYDFAWKHISKYAVGEGDDFLRSDNGDGPKQYYLSSKWEDDFVWAATWMYRATEDKTYLENSLPYLDFYAPPGWAYCWNDMWSGAGMQLTLIDKTHPELNLQEMYRTAQGKNQYDPADFSEQIEKAMDTWEKNYATPQGYAFMSTWGSARYDTAMQLICLIYDKYMNNDKPSKRSDWAKGQMEYLLGHNDITYLENRDDGVTHGKRCFVVGYNEYSAQYPHHRAASGLLRCEDPSPQRHVLYGALVGGPDGKDAHKDVTSDYIYNEVTIDYNAAFVGAAAGLYHFYGKDTDKPDENFPPVEENTGDSEGGGNGYWVEAFAVDDLHDDGAGVTKISFQVRTNSSKPSDKISIRYYFDSSEISNISSVEAKELYDQSSAEASEEGADGITSQPKKYDGKANTYYVEVSWDGYKIANSGKKYQFSMGMYYGDNWNPENDWSYQGLPSLSDSEMFGDNNEVKTDYICVYDDGVLVGGIEPDGSTPATEAPKETTAPATTKPATTTTKTTTATTKTTTATTKTTTKAPVSTGTASTGTPAIPRTTEAGNNEPKSDTTVTYGDVDCNGVVNIVDVLTVNQYLVGITTDNDVVDEKNADVDNDGVITDTDAMNILKSLVNLVTLPIK
ncbi:MAG TPA: glycoside hydrolase [Ruminococcus sp.]|nr:glycoside hydrolase [Ruminococcus sp.]